MSVGALTQANLIPLRGWNQTTVQASCVLYVGSGNTPRNAWCPAALPRVPVHPTSDKAARRKTVGQFFLFPFFRAVQH